MKCQTCDGTKVFVDQTNSGTLQGSTWEPCPICSIERHPQTLRPRGGPDAKMIALCGKHDIPNGWAHCRCGLVPAEGADFCGCYDHKVARREPRFASGVEIERVRG